MRRLLTGMFTATLFAATCVVAAGCADNESGLFVRSVLVLQPPECSVRADPTSAHWLGGVMDTALTSTYEAALLIGNQLVSRGDRDKVRTETSRVVIEGAEVAVLSATGGVLQEFSVPATGFVDPGTSDEPGYGSASATLIPSGVVSAGPGEVFLVTAEVRVFGTTLGGDEIESAKLTFPITICYGCLISFPADADDPAQPGYQCATGTGEAVDAPCRIGQDEPVDCRVCVGSNPACQAP